MPKLKSRKREMFAIEVASMTPLASAYVAAGYRDTPWARYNASKLAHVPEVAERIDELMTEFSDRSGIKAEYIQRKLLPLIESDPRLLFETRDDGSGNKIDRLKALSALPSGLAAAIQKIRLDPKTGAVIGIDLHNKNETSNTLLRSVGALVDRHEHSGKDGASIAPIINLMGHREPESA
jgi:Terminase small subunit